MDLKKEIISLKYSSIPVNIIKSNEDLPYVLYNNFNNSISPCLFPEKLKLANVSPVYKKGGRNDKTNYRPINILPAISKIYEKLLFHQINNYFDRKLCKYQCGFRKGYSSQYVLILMIEKWKKCIDKGGFAGALLTDLSKAFDCFSHELPIAKLSAYGFNYHALKLIYSYLFQWLQRVRINSSFSFWCEIICGVHQGSILGALFLISSWQIYFHSWRIPIWLIT